MRTDQDRIAHNEDALHELRDHLDNKPGDVEEQAENMIKNPHHYTRPMMNLAHDRLKDRLTKAVDLRLALRKVMKSDEPIDELM